MSVCMRMAPWQTNAYFEKLQGSLTKINVASFLWLLVLKYSDFFYFSTPTDTPKKRLRDSISKIDHYNNGKPRYEYVVLGKERNIQKKTCFNVLLTLTSTSLGMTRRFTWRVPNEKQETPTLQYACPLCWTICIIPSICFRIVQTFHICLVNWYLFHLT